MTTKKAWIKIKNDPILLSKARESVRKWHNGKGKFYKGYTKVCPKCGCQYKTKKKSQKVCSKRCGPLGNFGKKHPRWKGGKYIDDKGYRVITIYDHPTYKYNRMYEHRYVMEQYLGRYLKRSEIIHHKNYNPSDNRIENLLLFKHSGEHIKFHFEESKKLYLEVQKLRVESVGLRVIRGLTNK